MESNGINSLLEKTCLKIIRLGFLGSSYNSSSTKFNSYGTKNKTAGINTFEIRLSQIVVEDPFLALMEEKLEVVLQPTDPN